jgi:FcoT-like thioesterase domain
MIASLSEIAVPTETQESVGSISQAFLHKVLRPYIPTKTDYLRSAALVQVAGHERQSKEEALMVSEGRFSIPTSCYIQSTGHFNAVEFLICFNQLAYTSLGFGIAEGFFANLSEAWASESTRTKLKSVTERVFFDNQLSSMLILKTETRFQKIIDAADFKATLSIQSVFSRRDTFFVETECVFSDDKGGKAEGKVLLAYASHANVA